MGNFERSTQRPKSTESRTFALWSDAKRKLLHGHGIRYGIAYMLITGLACGISMARRKTLSNVLVAGVYALAGMGITEVLVASLADAIDVTRHFFIAATILDMELLIVLWMLLGLNYRFHSKSAEQQELR